jgi:DNA-binding SARP family transcriptional activator
MALDVEHLTRALADRYEIGRELGRGASAVVYLATDIKHDRQVALKLLRAGDRSVSHERFLHEIRTTARLHHPYLLPLYDSGEVGDQLFFSMPFAEAGTLRDRLRRDGRLPVSVALRMIEQAGRALAYVHSRGIVHRDVKPENIMLSGTGDALVTDFGIAYALDEARREMKTGEGMVIGTPAYMSPEQMLGERNLDARTDVYSLGCVLFELLAGRPPFVASTSREVMKRRLTEDAPAIRSVAPDVPMAVDRALARALARNPIDRFESVDAFLSALGRPNAVRVLTLGGLAILADGVPVDDSELPAQALALLAMLVHAGPRGVTADTVVERLWPSAEPEQARGHLSRGLRALRRGLGLGDDVHVGRVISLHGEGITSDVGEYLEVLGAGGHEEALALYDGPFLYGFAVPGAPQFAAWARSVRDELEAHYHAALEQAARAAMKRGHHARAILWWRRLAQEDPLNARVTRGLMLALVAGNDAPGAIRQAGIYEALIEQELGLPPDHDVVALADQIRRGEDVSRLADTLEHPSAPRPLVRHRHRSWIVTVIALAAIAALIAALILIDGRSP